VNPPRATMRLMASGTLAAMGAADLLSGRWGGAIQLAVSFGLYFWACSDPDARGSV